jgi:hypothetical protein
MSNSTLFIAASIRQGHERFSAISRGRQCSFMSFSALFCAQSFPVKQWTTKTIEQILIEGDNSLENRIIHCLPEVHLISITKDQYQLLKYLYPSD